ncbi:helix-turn-helix transcriptional regulator [Streptomyces sp. NPDC012935]|uniref:helix-turn-helix transcriptional regulator n=1 Tax=Streptomyces sp. NPDC012935 TaxID=3364857 RepID=UPI0036C8861F
MANTVPPEQRGRNPAGAHPPADPGNAVREHTVRDHPGRPGHILKSHPALDHSGRGHTALKRVVQDADALTLSLSAQLSAVRPVGRAAEAHRLTEHLSAAAGAGGTVLLRGPAGVGKSCLLDDVLGGAARNWHVLRLTGDVLDEARRVPFRTLASLTAAAPGARSASSGEPAAAVRLVAEGQRHDDVHLAAARLFRLLREERPTVVVLDDPAYADPDTLALIGHLTRTPARHPLVVAAATRVPRDAPVGAFGALLAREEGRQRLHTTDLGNLDTDGTALLLTQALGTPPAPALAAHAHTRGGGNPFFVLQTLLDLAEHRRLERRGGAWHLVGGPTPLSPDRRRQILQRALGGTVSSMRVARAAALLRVVALTRLDLLARVSRLSSRATESAFDSLVRHGVLRAVAPGTYGFASEVVRDALYEDLGPAARRCGHRTAADWLLRLAPAADLQEDIAAHVAQTADHGDARAIEILAGEAGRAFSRTPGAAVPWYRKAVDITPPDHPDHAELVTRLTLSLLVAGHPEEAARTGGTAPGGVAGANRLSSLVIGALTEHGAVGEARALVDEARAAAPGHLVLTAQAALLHLMTGRTREATALAAEADARLERAPLRDRITALGYLVPLHCMTDGYRSLEPLAIRLRDAAAEAPASLRLNALSTLSYLHSMRGDTHACAGSLAEADALLADCGWHFFRGSLVAARVHNAVQTGDWSTGHAHIVMAARQMRESGSLVHLGPLRLSEATLHAHQGNWRAARQAADAIARTQPLLNTAAVVAHSVVDLMQGDLDSGRRRLTERLGEGNLPDHLRARLLVRLAEIEAEAGCPEAVTGLLAAARDHGMDSHDYTGFTEARLAHGHATGDTAALLEAASVAERHDLSFLKAKAHLYLGTAGVDAERHLRSALDVFHRLGALPWRRRAGVELRRRNLKVPRHRASSPAELTATETQIARYVQLGRSNREIAQALSLSVKTVERHLSRVYAKTDCRSRLQLVRALDGGLLGERPAGPGRPGDAGQGPR